MELKCLCPWKQLAYDIEKENKVQTLEPCFDLLLQQKNNFQLVQGSLEMWDQMYDRMFMFS